MKNADTRSISNQNNKSTTRKIIAIVILGLILLGCLLACGYFGLKTIHRSHLRRTAMDAYEKKDYVLAELLLLQYVSKDPNAEAEFVALANIYHEFGNTGMEAQMWQSASSLNPLNKEYYENMLTSAANSGSYGLLHSILGRKAIMNEELSDLELYLYVISSYRTDNSKEGADIYKKKVSEAPEAFHKNDLGRMAEFMANYPTLTRQERNNYLNQASQSEDPLVKFEALYTRVLLKMAAQEDIETNKEEIEALLKELVETNYYSATPILIDFYFSLNRFEDVIALSEPYLKSIDDSNVYLLYAEACTFTSDLDALKELKKKLQKRNRRSLKFMIDYCEILIAYSENDEAKLAAEVRKSGKIVSSPLSRFVRLRVAMGQNSYNEILAVAREIFPQAPFHDLHDRAAMICLDYITEQIDKLNDPTQMAELAKVLATFWQGNRLLTDIILLDNYKKGLAKETDLMAALEQFPDDLLLIQIVSEFLVFSGKDQEALPLIEKALSNDVDDRKLDFLHMLALDHMERHDEAAEIFVKLVEKSNFDFNQLSQYFQFCWEYQRTSDLSTMATRLEGLKDGKIEQYGTFFHAAEMLLGEDEEKKQEALKMLVSTLTNDPNFTFYAANRLNEAGMLKEAEEKYKSILGTYSNKPLILVNLSEVYKDEGDQTKSLEAAKEAFDMEKSSLLPAFIYAKRLSEADRYEDAVGILNFPRRSVNYREDVVELWVDCMHHVIEKSIAGERYMQAEEQCKHLLTIAPDDEFGKDNLEKVRELLKPKKDGSQSADVEAAAPAA